MTHVHRGRAAVAGLGALSLAAAIIAFSPEASALAPGTGASFEDNDANLVANTVTDWASFSSMADWAGTPRYRTRGPASVDVGTGTSAATWQVLGLEDDAAVGTDTGFAGGVKQDNDCGGLTPGKAPNKDDLARVYMASRVVSDHVYLMLSWVRIPQNTTSASAHVGYEFNQASDGDDSTVDDCTGKLAGMGGPLAKRLGGDMLVVYDFEGGSLAPHLKLSRWLKTGKYLPTGATCTVNTSSPTTGCWGNTKDLTDLGFAEGAVNFSSVKKPPTTPDALKPTTLATDPSNSEFGEAGLDLTAAGVFTSGACSSFGRAYAVSRSSGNSSQAAMEDIVGPGDFALSNCGSINVTKSASDDNTAGMDGAEFELWPGGTTDFTGDPLASCTVGGGDGQCGDVPSFPSLKAGDYVVHESVPPTGYSAADDQTITVGTSSTPVGASFTDVAEPGSITITKVDDAGAAVAGAVFTAYTDAAKNHSAGECTTGDGSGAGGDGDCEIAGLDPGTYYVDELPPTGYIKDPSVTWPVSKTVARDTATSLSVINPRTFKTIVIVCQESNTSLYPSQVSIDGAADTTTLSATQAGSAGLDVTKLCGLTAGSASGQLAADDSSNPHSASVDIPNSQP